MGLFCRWPTITEWEMYNVHHCLGPPVSEMTYTVSNGTLNSTVPYHSSPNNTDAYGRNSDDFSRRASEVGEVGGPGGRLAVATTACTCSRLPLAALKVVAAAASGVCD